MQSTWGHVFPILVLFVSDSAVLKRPLTVVLKFCLVFLSKEGCDVLYGEGTYVR